MRYGITAAATAIDVVIVETTEMCRFYRFISSATQFSNDKIANEFTLFSYGIVAEAAAAASAVEIFKAIIIITVEKHISTLMFL